MRQGETRSITATVETAALAKDDITNFVFEWRMWHILTGTVVTKTVGDGITISNQTTNRGEVVITLEDDDTTDLAPLTYDHQLRMDYGGFTQVMMKGLLQLDPSLVIPEAAP
jgi:hypothetical protein